jgi:hypothetical protein
MRDYRFRLFIYALSVFLLVDTLLPTTVQHKDKISTVKSRRWVIITKKINHL